MKINDHKKLVDKLKALASSAKKAHSAGLYTEAAELIELLFDEETQLSLKDAIGSREGFLEERGFDPHEDPACIRLRKLSLVLSLTTDEDELAKKIAETEEDLDSAQVKVVMEKLKQLGMLKK